MHINEGATALRSHHQYGRALDVGTIDMDGNGRIEQDEDGNLMEQAARRAGASWTSRNYRSHVHADWR